MLAGKRTGVAGKSVEAVGHHESALGHALGRGFARLLEHADGVLLGVDIFLGKGQVSIVIDTAAQLLLDLIRTLAAPQHGGGTLADADGVAHPVAGAAEDLGAFAHQLAVGQQAGADIDAVDSVQADFGPGNRLEVLTLGDDGAYDAAAVRIRNGLHQRVARHDGDAQTADPVGLYGESALARHRLDDGLDTGPGLNGLVRSQVADVAGTHRQDILSEQRELLVHHPLHDGGGIDARHVIVLEGRHERQRTGCDHQLVGLHVEDLLGGEVLDRQPLAGEDVTDHAVEQDSLVGIARQGLGDIESAHAAEAFLLLKEEELVGLHQELAADLVVVVDHQVVDARLAKLLPDGQAGRTGADDGYRGLEDTLGRLGGLVAGHRGETLDAGAGDLLHAVHLGDADAADVAVHDHLAGAALADAALHGAVTVFQTVMVNRKSCLVQGGRDGLALLALDLAALEFEFLEVLCGHLQNRMGFYLIHICF